MEKFTGSVSTSTDASVTAIGAGGGAFWRPVEHVGKVHLFAGRGGEEPAEYPWGESLTSTADIVVAFDDENSWNVYYEVAVYQTALQPVVCGEGVNARRVVQMESAAGRNYWAFEDLNEDEAAMVNAWAVEHLGQNADGSYGVIGEEAPGNGAGPTPVAAAGSGGAAVGGATPPPDEEPF